MIPSYLIDLDIALLPQTKTDLLVIGTGIAGLFTAIEASEDRQVLMITKKTLLESNTRYAQGGIAAVTAEDDSPAYHKQDTLTAGAGLCREEAVEVLVSEGPERVKELISLGTTFDVENGELALTQEGAHSHRRILHANGDATGYEIVRALAKQVASHASIKVWDEHFVIDLVTESGECRGAIVQDADGERIYVKADAVVLCSGGAGQLYRYTTNPEVATADGVAMAYRAGAEIRDMEFIQFHPTSLCYPGAPRFLISEAVRGEGAVLRNIRGERFMHKYHPQLELAPRDIVARAIVNEMELTNATQVYLDITHETLERIKLRFPTIYETCMNYGLDMSTDWIPVAPAAHYMMGGVKTDLYGESSIRRLFACGEVSSTGVHGANRLASNSLSEAIVFGKRIIARICELTPLPDSIPFVPSFKRKEASVTGNLIHAKRLALQKAMVRGVGLRRSEQGLLQAKAVLEKELDVFNTILTTKEEYEFANLLTCAILVTEGALHRKESRGAHYREDYPDCNDLTWGKHTLQQRERKITEEVSHAT